MKHLKNVLLVALAGGLSLSSATTYAEESELENESQLAHRLLVCRAIDSAVERVDCYDNVARTLSQQSLHSGVEAREAAQLRRAETRERTTMQREEAQQTRTDDFGREHRQSQASEQDGQVYIEIAEAWQNPRGLWRFRLTSGAEWHQTQSGRFTYDEANNYYIERGALNSFRLGWDGSNRNIRVRRID